MSREIDALVAERVMGLTKHRRDPFNAAGTRGYTDAEAMQETHIDYCWGWRHPGEGEGFGHALPRYSTNISAAWEVRCKLVACGFDVTVGSHGGLGNVTDDTCEITGDEDADERWAAGAATAPLAICLAALRAVGVEPPTIAEPSETKSAANPPHE